MKLVLSMLVICISILCIYACTVPVGKIKYIDKYNYDGDIYFCNH